ncbi:MAG TPA: hypothetical protein VEI02_02210 [Planctomycetota bacterium]|nr:hypothetical protein [Planctomycetota bacterium]
MKFPSSPFVRRGAGLLALGALAWIAGVATIAARVEAFGQVVGPAAPAPETWPADASLPRASGVDALYVFVHPKCPCTRATYSELREVLARAERKPVVTIVSVPADPGVEPEPPALGPESHLPAAVVRLDRGGAEARRFGAATSGHVVLYDAAGRLRYAGGVTASRARYGDSDARRALIAALGGAAPEHVDVRPTFGCELFSGATACERCRKGD